MNAKETRPAEAPLNCEYCDKPTSIYPSEVKDWSGFPVCSAKCREALRKLILNSAPK